MKETNWRDLTVGSVQMAVETDGRLPVRNMRVKWPMEWMSLLNRAARKRNITVTGYMRRAIMAMVCHDLGLEWFATMEPEPNVQPGRPAASNPPVHLAGEGFGPWRIVRVVE